MPCVCGTEEKTLGFMSGHRADILELHLLPSLGMLIEIKVADKTHYRKQNSRLINSRETHLSTRAES